MTEYNALLWLPGESLSAKRVTVTAEDSTSARALLVQKHGDDAVITLLNDDDPHARPW